MALNGRSREPVVKDRIRGPIRASLEIPPLIEEWLESCRGRSLSPQTLHLYRNVLAREFVPFLEREAVTDLSEVDQRLLDLFAAGLGDRNLSRFTVRTYLRPVITFAGWAKEQGLGDIGRPQLPKAHRQVRDILSSTEIQALEDVCQTERDKLIVRVLSDIGLRVGELCRLDVDDIKPGGDGFHYLKVKGKGQVPRMAPIPKAWLPRLLRLATRGRPREATSGALFVSRRRSTYGYDRVTVSGVQAMIHFAALESGIKKRIHPHLLRHTAITRMMVSGMNSFVVSAVVGNYENLGAYAHISPTAAAEALNRALSD